MKSDLSTVPLTALSAETKEYIANMLNSTKFENENCNSLQRDWRGLTCFLEVINADVMSRIESQKDPTNYILERIKENITMKDFQTRMKLMDRWDIINDTQKMFENDAAKYFKQQQRANSIEQPTEVDMMKRIFSTMDALTLDDDNRVIQGLNKADYDAFLLYAAEDADFANEIMQKLQIEYKLKLCCYKNMISDLKEDEAMKTLISKRCKKLLVILSPDFLSYPTNKSLLNYAQFLSVEKQERKIVPCLYKSYQQINIPYELQCMSCVDYTRSEDQDFWMLLFYSIQAPNSTQDAIISNTLYSLEYSMLDECDDISRTTQKTDEETDEEISISLQIENCVRDVKMMYLNNKNEKNKRLVRERLKDLVESISWNRKRINQRRKSRTVNPSNTETTLFSSMPSVPSDNISFSSSSSLS